MTFAAPFDGHAPLPAQQILEGITDPFAVFDQEFRVVFANTASTYLLGAAPHEAVGRPLWDLWPELLGMRVAADLRSAMSSGNPVTTTEYFARLQQWFEIRAYPLGSSGLAMYSRDVTPRKREEELRARLSTYVDLRADVATAFGKESNLRSILQECVEAVVKNLRIAFCRIWLADANAEWLELEASAGRYTHTDGAHRRVRVGELKIGLIAAERRAHLTNDVMHDPRVANKSWASQEGMVAFAGYPLLVGSSLIGVLALFAKFPLEDDALNGLGSIGDAIAQGISRRRAQIELEDRARDLLRSNADLEQFAYVASHDLQEPLRMVASYNQLLARRYKGKLDHDADEFIAYSVEGVTRMQRLINDLLMYSRLGTRGKEFEQFPMLQAFDVARQNLKKAAEDAGATLTHDELPTITGDFGQFVQLLQNLLGNAIKFRGKEPPVVHLGCQTRADEWLFSVKDNGVGMETQYFERVFIIFQRLHPREVYPGTGIGLSICKKVVERHGGRIWVESTLGQGTTVCFALPFLPPRLRRSIV